VSRKSVPFSAKPASAKHPAPTVVIDARSDDWVSDRHARGDEKPAADPSLWLDLAAERGLTEVFILSLIAPFALGWFWLVNAMAGRARF
jgi:hypothetical protein